jgi:hypothetical protein
MWLGRQHEIDPYAQPKHHWNPWEKMPTLGQERPNNPIAGCGQECSIGWQPPDRHLRRRPAHL